MRKTLMPLGWSEPLWLSILVVASVGFSAGFACATPLAAFAAISALTFDRRKALLSIGAVWFANQAIGYLVLGYPPTANSLGWGAVLGLAAVSAMMTARWSGAYSVSRAALPVAAFAVSFAVYQIVLFAAAFTVLGGTEDFTMAIVGRVLEINAIAMTGLLLLNGLRPVVRTLFVPSY